MLFCARLEVLLDLLSKHRHFYPPRYLKLIVTLMLCVALQRSINKEEKLYRDKIQDIEIQEDPVFIIGHWRSGTTYLHYLMSLDTENFAYPTTYQCFCPTVFLTFNEESRLYKFLNKTMGTRSRAIDNMELTLSSPQEEEWMYMPLGGFSYALEKLIFPKTGVSDFDEIIRLSTDEKTKEITHKIFKKLTFAYHKRILSKSPGHFSRIPLLKQLFPNSKFIFILRNPYDVVLSMMHAKKILGKILSLQKSAPDDIISVAKSLIFYMDVMKDNMHLLELNAYTTIKYEDLIKDPIRNIQTVYNTLGFKYTGKYDEALRAYVESRKDYKRNRFEMTSEAKRVIYDECQQIFDEYGYDK
jgi:omega-hydroxy-beta-dihydromenaquinone-9 sulfotransferase